MEFINTKRFNAVKKRIPLVASSLNTKRKFYTKKTLVFIKRKPFTSFFAILLVFLLLMIIGNVLFSPKPENTSTAPVAKKVQVYKLGSAPQVDFQGKVEKSGVVKIVAQAPGIVENINVYEGEQIDAGTNILSLASNYSGGNALTIARQIAQDQYSNASNTYNLQKDIIAKQRELADKNKSNGDLLKQIAVQSSSDTKALVDLDRTIVDGMVANIQTLESTNVNGSNNAAILQSKQILAQYQAALAQSTASYENLQVQTNQTSTDIANINYDIALKQLDLQQKSLAMTLDIARLSYNMAAVNEANMFPSTPFGGTVNKIFVHVGDAVNPGQPIAQISGFTQHVEIVASVPEEIAKNISHFEPSILSIKGKQINMIPTFVTKDAINGVLYAVLYDLDDSFAANLTDTSYIDVKIPIGTADTTNIDPFIPLDAVIQTENEAFVYVVDDRNIARVKKITLGQIQGKFVEVLSGLPQNASVIIDRNVIEGDKVIVSN